MEEGRRVPGSAPSIEHHLGLIERIGVVVPGVVVVFLISPLLRVPSLRIPLVALGSPVHFQLSRELAVGILAGALAWVGTGHVLVASPSYERGARIYSHRILPVLAAIATTVFWQRQGDASAESRLVTAAVIGLALSLIIWAQYEAMAGESPRVLRLRTVIGIISLSLALYLWIVIFGTRARSLLSSPAAAALSCVLAIDILQYEAVGEWRLWRAALAIGLVTGESAWALNYWRASPLEAGFLLLTVNYVLIGLTRRLFQDALDRLAVLEHAFLAAVMLVAVGRIVR